MTAVNITSVAVLDNPSSFTGLFRFQIEYECLQDLKHDLEWKLVYVGSAESEKHDQVLDVIEVGPVVRGQYKFIFEADPPDPSKIPQEDIVGVTVLLLKCSYNGKEFIQVGYYVNNDYQDEELREFPPEKPLIDRLMRNILDKPRVTRFPVEFDPVEPVPDLASEAEAMIGAQYMANGAPMQAGLFEQQQQQQQVFGQQPQMFEQQQPQGCEKHPQQPQQVYEHAMAVDMEA